MTSGSEGHVKFAIQVVNRTDDTTNLSITANVNFLHFPCRFLQPFPRQHSQHASFALH